MSEKGGGVYKLKNEHGKVVRDTRVKEELSRILGCFNIQLDNPVCAQLGCPERGPAPGTPRREPDVSGVRAGRG